MQLLNVALRSLEVSQSLERFGQLSDANHSQIKAECVTCRFLRAFCFLPGCAARVSVFPTGALIQFAPPVLLHVEGREDLEIVGIWCEASVRRLRTFAAIALGFR